MKTHTLLLLACTAAAPGWAQTPRRIVAAGEPLPGLPGTTVLSLDIPGLNVHGGMAVPARVADSSGETELIWGGFGAHDRGILHAAGLHDGELQRVIWDVRLARHDFTYRASIEGGGAFPAMWKGTDMILASNGVSPTVMSPVSLIQLGDVSDDGVVHFPVTFQAAGTNDDHRDTGIYDEAMAPTAYLNGNTVPNVPGTVGGRSFDWGVRRSPNGEHEIVGASTGTWDNQRWFVGLDGEGLTVGGRLIAEDVPLPASFGSSPSASWRHLRAYGVSNDGDYFVLAGTASEDYLVRNGLVWAKTGGQVGSSTIGSTIQKAAIDRVTGRIAFLADVVVGPTQAMSVFVEDRVVLQDLQAIDWDGDGTPDPEYVLRLSSSFTRIEFDSAGNLVLYALAFEPLTGQLRFVIVQFGEAIGRHTCSANANWNGRRAELHADGSSLVVDDQLTLRATDLPPDAWSLAVASRTEGFVPNLAGAQGDLCLGGEIGRAPLLVQADGGGTALHPMAPSSLPQPQGPVAAVPGETWHFQVWYRDAGILGATSNFTSALAVTFR